VIAWTDIETTGLVASEGHILELSIALADEKAPTEIVDYRTWAVHALFDGVAVIQDGRWAYPDQFVIDMHTRNGLWEACRTGVYLCDVEAEARAWLAPLGSGPCLTMAGASVGSFDLGWIRHHMPDLATLFSHRVLDTTSIRMFAEDLGMPRDLCPKGEEHRAEADVAAAISHYHTCFQYLQEKMQ
jgi:oligoribonuclease (3'-5' exoribonuclease)